MFLIILIKSLIIGAWSASAWARSGTHVSRATTQGMGAFRTLGELNSCEGDPASHFSLVSASSLRLGLFRCSRLLHPGR